MPEVQDGLCLTLLKNEGISAIAWDVSAVCSGQEPLGKGSTGVAVCVE